MLKHFFSKSGLFLLGVKMLIVAMLIIAGMVCAKVGPGMGLAILFCFAATLPLVTQGYNLCAVTASVNAAERQGDFYENLPVEAATILYQGSIGAINAAGNVVPAADTAGLRVLGRIEPNPDGFSGDTDNSGGIAGALTANLKRGVFIYSNSAGDALTALDIGKFCYIEDAQTVNKTGGVNKIPAGRFMGFQDSDATTAIVDLRQRPTTESSLP